LLAWAIRSGSDWDFNVTDCYLLDPINSWSEFWKMAMSYDNDLPGNGPPPVEAARLYNSGNEKMTIACLGDKTKEGEKMYYHVEFYTS